jgi:FMN-dependent NADH-azoreductase
MQNVLRLDATINLANSVSRRLTDGIIARFRAVGADIVERDLSTGVRPIDAAWIGAASTPAENRTTEQGEIILESDTYLAEIRAADIIVIGLPVYNFGVPSQLKSWLDHLARKGQTFNYTESGPKGLLTGKRAIVALSSGGTVMGSEIDFASGYVRHMMGFFGITDLEFVAADRMAVEPNAALLRAETAIHALAM